jgi:Ca-activated chloride channel family protein
LNENLLQQIAGATGGFYLPLRGADTMDTLYERGLEPLPKSESSEKLIRRYHEQFQWPLAAAILFLLAEMFLPERFLQTANKSKVQSPKSKVETAAVAILVSFLFLPFAANASPASALSDYKSGNFTNALTEFSRLAEIQTNDLRLVFNAGAAAYRATNYDAALQNFQLVTLSSDLKLQQQAFYNLGNTLYRMGELKFTPDADGLGAMTETWTNAMQSYAHAAQLNTNDADANYNFTFVKNQLEMLQALREAIRQAKMSADDAVRRAQFHRALEIMQQLTQNKIAAKQFQDYIKKLKDIDDIATPNQK